MNIHAFQFNPFQENTYILYNEQKQGIVIDPGCFEGYEKKMLDDFIKKQGIQLEGLWLTHAHIDHVLGIPHIHSTYGLSPIMHKGELELYEKTPQISDAYGIPCAQLPDPKEFVEEGDKLTLGDEQFEVLFTPGHSPASICFFNRTRKKLISGDVLFQGSIGRTDLPGGNMDTLLESIQEKLMELEDDVEVFSGHGSSTTIGAEKKSNPFLQNF